MAEWKKYTAEHNEFPWSFTMEIRNDDVVKEKCLAMINFFTDAPSLLDGYDSVFEAFVNFLAPTIMVDSMDYSMQGIIQKFDNREGYCKLREEDGFRFIWVDGFEIEYDQFTIKEGGS